MPSHRALPPLRPPLRPSATAAGSFAGFSGSGSSGRPVAIFTTNAAGWFVSRGMRERFCTTFRNLCYKSGRGQVRSSEIRAASLGLFCACSGWTNRTLSPGFFPERLSAPDAPMALRSRDRSLRSVDGLLLSHWDLRVAICEGPISATAVARPTQLRPLRNLSPYSAAWTGAPAGAGLGRADSVIIGRFPAE